MNDTMRLLRSEQRYTLTHAQQQLCLNGLALLSLARPRYFPLCQSAAARLSYLQRFYELRALYRAERAERAVDALYRAYYFADRKTKRA